MFCLHHGALSQQVSVFIIHKAVEFNVCKNYGLFLEIDWPF